MQETRATRLYEEIHRLKGALSNTSYDIDQESYINHSYLQNVKETCPPVPTHMTPMAYRGGGASRHVSPQVSVALSPATAKQIGGG